MKRDQPFHHDELQMRAFWRQWHALMTLSEATRTPMRQVAAV
jgi:hypothetical protein